MKPPNLPPQKRATTHTRADGRVLHGLTFATAKIKEVSVYSDRENGSIVLTVRDHERRTNVTTQLRGEVLTAIHAYLAEAVEERRKQERARSFLEDAKPPPKYKPYRKAYIPTTPPPVTLTPRPEPKAYDIGTHVILTTNGRTQPGVIAATYDTGAYDVKSPVNGKILASNVPESRLRAV